MKVNPRQAHVRIVCVGETPLVSDFPGIIRSLEVRQTLVDEVAIYNCFRPGDIVQAEVVSFQSILLADRFIYPFTHLLFIILHVVLPIVLHSKFLEFICQISLGDKRSYYLSTAKNEYGVIFAKSVAGATMIPIRWASPLAIRAYLLVGI